MRSINLKKAAAGLAVALVTTGGGVAVLSTTAQAHTGSCDVHVLGKGAGGVCVESIQNMVNQCYGWGVLRPDGVYGDRTRNAVIAVQRRARIDDDGIVGPQTWPVLRSCKAGVIHRVAATAPQRTVAKPVQRSVARPAQSRTRTVTRPVYRAPRTAARTQTVTAPQRRPVQYRQQTPAAWAAEVKRVERLAKERTDAELRRLFSTGTRYPATRYPVARHDYEVP